MQGRNDRLKDLNMVLNLPFFFPRTYLFQSNQRVIFATERSLCNTHSHQYGFWIFLLLLSHIAFRVHNNKGFVNSLAKNITHWGSSLGSTTDELLTLVKLLNFLKFPFLYLKNGKRKYTPECFQGSNKIIL